MSNEVWLVSYGETDDREMTPAQISEALGRGEITLGTIVWRDGMAGWEPIEKTEPLMQVLGRRKLPPPKASIPVPRRDKTMPGIPRQPVPAVAAPKEERKRKVTAMGIGGYRRLPTPHPPIRRVTAPPPPEPPVELDSDPGALPMPPPVAPVEQKTPLVPRATTRLGIGHALEVVPETPGPESLDEALIDSIPPSETLAALAREDFAREAAAQPGVDLALDQLVEDTSVDAPLFPSPPPMPVADDDAPIELGAAHKKSPVPGQVAPKDGARAAMSDDDMDQAAIPTPRQVQPTPLQATPRLELVADSSPDPLAELGAAAFGASDAPLAREEASERAAAVTSMPAGVPRPSRGTSPLLLGLGAIVLFGAGYLFAAKSGGGNASAPLPQATPALAPPAPVPPPVAEAPAEPAAPPPSEAAPALAQEQTASAPAAPAVPPAAAPVAPTPAARSEKPSSQASQPVSAPAAPTPAAPTPVAPAAVAAPATPTPAVAGGATAAFDKDAAAAALGRSAAQASACRHEGDPSGVAKVEVTFSATGRAVRATISGPPFAGTKTGGCIANAMRQTGVPPFTGDRVTVKKTVVIN